MEQREREGHPNVKICLNEIILQGAKGEGRCTRVAILSPEEKREQFDPNVVPGGNYDI